MARYFTGRKRTEWLRKAALIGYTPVQVARMAGVDRRVVYRATKRLGLEWPGCSTGGGTVEESLPADSRDDQAPA
jgi:hypothetical protein